MAVPDVMARRREDALEFGAFDVAADRPDRRLATANPLQIVVVRPKMLQQVLRLIARPEVDVHLGTSMPEQGPSISPRHTGITLQASASCVLAKFPELARRRKNAFEFDNFKRGADYLTFVDARPGRCDMSAAL